MSTCPIGSLDYTYVPWKERKICHVGQQYRQHPKHKGGVAASQAQMGADEHQAYCLETSHLYQVGAFLSSQVSSSDWLLRLSLLDQLNRAGSYSPQLVSDLLPFHCRAVFSLYHTYLRALYLKPGGSVLSTEIGSAPIWRMTWLENVKVYPFWVHQEINRNRD